MWCWIVNAQVGKGKPESYFGKMQFADRLLKPQQARILLLRIPDTVGRVGLVTVALAGMGGNL